VRNIEINTHGTIFNRTRQFIAYADDVAVNGRTMVVLNEVLLHLQTVTVFIWLVINTEKSKYMKIKETINVANTGNELHGKNFERANTFK
jgi:hypothetical protein